MKPTERPPLSPRSPPEPVNRASKAAEAAPDVPHVKAALPRPCLPSGAQERHDADRSLQTAAAAASQRGPPLRRSRSVSPRTACWLTGSRARDEAFVRSVSHSLTRSLTRQVFLTCVACDRRREGHRRPRPSRSWARLDVTRGVGAGRREPLVF